MVRLREDKNLSLELKLYISSLVSEILNDPDFGLELKEEIKMKLDKIKRGEVKFYPLEEVKKKLKIK